MEISGYRFLLIQLTMDINISHDLKRNLEKMMKQKYLVQDKFHDLKKYIPALLEENFNRMNKK